MHNKRLFKLTLLMAGLFVVSVLGMAAAQDTVTDEPKAVVEQYYELVANETDTDTANEAIATLLDPAFVFYGPNNAEPMEGTDAYAEFVGGERVSFPDLEWTVEEIIAEEDVVVTRWTAHGTHEGDFQGLSPTGNEIDLFGMDYFRVEDGKITEVRRFFDVLTLARQLGIYQ